jgi:hypothetical protein
MNRDAYLCVGNMSIPLNNAEEEAISAGLKMLEEVPRVREGLLLRIGIASGPLIGIFNFITSYLSFLILIIICYLFYYYFYFF